MRELENKRETIIFKNIMVEMSSADQDKIIRLTKHNIFTTKTKRTLHQYTLQTKDQADTDMKAYNKVTT